MTPLLVATGGFIPCRSPLKIATSGFIGTCGIVEPEPEPIITRPVLEGSTGGGTVSRKQSKSNRPILQLYQPLHEEQFKANIVIEEDDEILSIVSLLVGAGIIK